MNLKIRLARFGSKRKPCYKIVIANACSSRNGKFIDIIGQYNSLIKCVFNTNELKQKIFLWVLKGAKLTIRIKKILDKC